MPQSWGGGLHNLVSSALGELSKFIVNANVYANKDFFYKCENYWQLICKMCNSITFQAWSSLFIKNLGLLFEGVNGLCQIKACLFFPLVKCMSLFNMSSSIVVTHQVMIFHKIQVNSICVMTAAFTKIIVLYIHFCQYKKMLAFA